MIRHVAALLKRSVVPTFIFNYCYASEQLGSALLNKSGGSGDKRMSIMDVDSLVKNKVLPG